MSVCSACGYDGSALAAQAAANERDAELLRRFREAGWEIADDGDPYRPEEAGGDDEA